MFGGMRRELMEAVLEELGKRRLRSLVFGPRGI